MLVKTEDLMDPKVNIMIVGPPGSGKTQSIASLYLYVIEKLRKAGKNPADHPRKIAIFDLDTDGALPLIRIAQDGTGKSVSPSIYGGWLSDLMVYRYRARGKLGHIAEKDDISRSMQMIFYDKFRGDWNTLYDMLDPATGYWLDPPNAPAIVVIDSATALEKLINGMTSSVREREVSSAIANERVRFADWEFMKQKELEFVRSGTNLPAHFVYLVHDELREQQVHAAPQVSQLPDGTYKETPAVIGTGSVFVVPALVGSLRDTLAQEFTAVLYSRYDNGRYQWVVRPRIEGMATIRCAKTRTRDDLPTVMEQDFRKLLI